MKTIISLFCFLVLVSCSFGADEAAKPKLKVAADGFPSGQDTPEGAACDLARSFIKRDVALFTNTCISPFGGGQNRTNYQTFLDTAIRGLKQEATKKEPSPGGPKAIAKVFAARHLRKNGPASYGWAAFGFQDVMFVDVGSELQDGRHFLCRTLVIKTPGGKWYVHPSPATDSLLSAGLNDEVDSKLDFADAYQIQK